MVPDWIASNPRVRKGQPFGRDQQYVVNPNGVPELTDELAACPAHRTTPLLSLPALARRLGVGEIRIKDESQRFGFGAFKALGGVLGVYNVLSGTVGEAYHSSPSFKEMFSGAYKELTKNFVFTTASSGNHGRSVAAGARLFGLNAQDTLHALATTTHAMGALREFADAGTDEYPFQVGYAARNGLTAALLASEGIAGTATALTGRAGFFRAFGKRDKDYAARLLEGLGTFYEMERVTYKPYPGGQWHRSVIDAFIALREQAAGDAIESAQVRMHPFEAKFLGLDYNGPFHTYAQAFFSIPFCAALAWLHGTVTFAALNRFDDPAVLDVMDKKTIQEVTSKIAVIDVLFNCAGLANFCLSKPSIIKSFARKPKSKFFMRF